MNYSLLFIHHPMFPAPVSRLQGCEPGTERKCWRLNSRSDKHGETTRLLLVWRQPESCSFGGVP